MSADFSKEISERRRAFLALRPRLHQMAVKYGLFDPAQMWITKNCMSKVFYDPEDLHSFLDGLSLMDTSTPTPPRDPMVADQNTLPQDLAPGGSGKACCSRCGAPRRLAFLSCCAALFRSLLGDIILEESGSGALGS
ncbi:hypothetical protein NDU88_003645 [Pleurodeles waltl]|uniref:Uncharacterized protein n=1 Tax=Pleurodeles waltl TaxID=8319 RepID=A0AAV7T5E9_PLEWA|nr:hypothetical protein NDU88_003645 [Pleurodeles waltl]